MVKDFAKKILLAMVFFAASQLNAQDGLEKPVVLVEEQVLVEQTDEQKVAEVVKVMQGCFTEAKEAGFSDEQILEVAAQYMDNVKAFQRSNNKKLIYLFVGGVAVGVVSTALFILLHKKFKK